VTDPAPIRAMAALARLQVSDADLGPLIRDVSAILAYVEQLTNLPDAEPAPKAPDWPPSSLREDVIAPADLAGSPAAFAPAFVDGFFVVPRPAAGDRR